MIGEYKLCAGLTLYQTQNLDFRPVQFDSLCWQQKECDSKFKFSSERVENILGKGAFSTFSINILNSLLPHGSLKVWTVW